MVIINAQQRDHIKTHILRKLSGSELLDLIQFLGTFPIVRTDDGSSRGDIKKELISAAREIERGLKRLEKLIAEGGASREKIEELDYHYSEANKDDLSMVELSFSASEASGTVHSLRKILAGINHQAQELERDSRQGRPAAEAYKHSLLLLMYWFDHKQARYRLSDSPEAPFMRFINYLFDEILQLAVQDARRHVQNALAHYKKHLSKNRKGTGLLPHLKRPQPRNQPKLEPFRE